MAKEYIEREAMLDIVEQQGHVTIDDIIYAPAADVVEVKHGQWDEIPNRYMSISGKDGSYSGHATSCSVCHEVNPNAFKTNYCPNCGAKMDGKEHNNAQID